MMIESISLNSYRGSAEEILTVDVSPITIFIGPNNSGKSKILEEILAYRNSHVDQQHLHIKARSQTNIVLKSVQFSKPSRSEIEQDLLNINSSSNSTLNLGESSLYTHSTLSITDIDQIMGFFDYPQEGSFIQAFDKYIYNVVVKLDGKNRLDLLNDQRAGNLQSKPTNYLNYLLLNSDDREKIRRIVYKSFEKYFVIDPTNLGQLTVKLSDIPPGPEQERSFTDESIQFFKNAIPIIQASDGVRAFSGILTTIVAGNPKVIIIDEPEAFLHPSLANALGKEIGRLLANSQKQVFASTHSANFLMGCIQSNAPMNVVRLTYKNGIGQARVLPSDKILHLMRNPLLRSTGILDGLFYDAVFVTESDSDRAFYQEINERLLQYDDDRGIQNCLFVNAQNKQTVWDIVKPLRELGIPTVGVVDVDILKEGGSVFSKLIDGSFVPEPTSSQMRSARESLYAHFKKIQADTGKEMKRNGGIDLLSPAVKNGADDFFDLMNKYGVFVVRNGELESWLENLEVSRNKHTWLTTIFESMGENPNELNYVKPAEGDVWDFIASIKKWFDNPTRKGVPV